jgi:uncharacterized protein YcbX
MTMVVGRVEAIFRYPVKSMRGEALEEAALGWHGIEGDRRFALRRIDDRGGFPFLTASKLPELVLFTPNGEDVITPEGAKLPLLSEALAQEMTRRSGVPVQTMQIRTGIFDDAVLSVISAATVAEVCRLGGQAADVRRFRPNVVVRPAVGVPFEEDAWVGGTLAFGEGDDAPTVAVTQRDLRCTMVNIDPDDARLAPEVMKAAVAANQNNAGVYATVTRTGRLAVGQAVVFRPAG